MRWGTDGITERDAPAAVSAAVPGVVMVGAAVTAVTVSYADCAPGPSALSSADPAVLASHPSLIDCEHQPVVRPAPFVLTCADAASSSDPVTREV